MISTRTESGVSKNALPLYEYCEPQQARWPRPLYWALLPLIRDFVYFGGSRKCYWKILARASTVRGYQSVNQQHKAGVPHTFDATLRIFSSKICYR